MGLGWSQEQCQAQCPQQPKEKPKKLPHNFQAIMQEANSPLKATAEDLYPRLHCGVFLSHKRKKYWVDEQSGHNCFMFFARDLLITWSENNYYWCWHSVSETKDVDIEVAALLDVCWLEVHGKVESSYLSPGATYEVVFVVRIEEISYGWNVPVTLRLLCPEQEAQEHREKLQDKPRNQWMELHVGDIVSPRESGEIQFSLFEYQDGRWKKGLVIKGAIIRPKK